MFNKNQKNLNFQMKVHLINNNKTSKNKKNKLLKKKLFKQINRKK